MSTVKGIDSQKHKGSFVKYNCALAKTLQSRNAALLFDRLEFWFSKMSGTFYKFIEPCDHPCYREGDSWSEELSMSKKVFRKAFDCIGVRYTSKTAFDLSQDKFQGKFFAYYQDRQSKKTVFVRNDHLLADFWARLKKEKNAHVSAHTSCEKKVRQDTHKGSPTADPLGSPHVREENILQKKTSVSEAIDVLTLNLEEKTEERFSKEGILEEILRLWSHHIHTISKETLSAHNKKRLYLIFEENFEDLSCFEEYLVKLSSSKFLMGEEGEKPFKISIFAALKKDFVQKVGAIFSTGTRTTKERLLAQENTQDHAKHIETFVNERVGGVDSALSCQVLRFWDRLDKRLIGLLETYVSRLKPTPEGLLVEITRPFAVSLLRHHSQALLHLGKSMQIGEEKVLFTHGGRLEASLS